MKYLVYSNKIVVYLSYDEFNKNNIYSYYLNGQLLDKGLITNYTFSNLPNDTLHHVRVLSNDKVIFDKDIKTALKKESIIVEVSDNTGTSDVTREIQHYLDLANSKNIIVFPKGKYLCGALFIHSDTEIYLEKDAFIQGSNLAKDYLPKIDSRFEGYEVKAYASLLNIGELDHTKEPTTRNIIIHGEGTIYGGGRMLRLDMLEQEKEHPVINDRWRNRLINISSCSNVIIDGLHLGHSASWNVHPIYSDHIYIHHCDFKSNSLPNGDGIDPDSCHDMDIFANVFDVGDDCVAIKSGKNPEGNIINIPCYNLSIFDCVSNGSHGCAIGSEISGGIHHIDIFNCDFAQSYFGVHIKTTNKRGSYVKDVRVKDTVTSTIYIHRVDYNDDGDSSNEITKFDNFTFNDVTITGISVKPPKIIQTFPHIFVEGFEKYDVFNNIYFQNIICQGDNSRIDIKYANCYLNNVVSQKVE